MGDDDRVRSLEQLKSIPDEAFDSLVKEADRRSNGDETLRDRILTEMGVRDFLRTLAKNPRRGQPLSPRGNTINDEPDNAATNGIGLELGLELPREENPNKKRTLPKKGTMVNEEDGKRPRISSNEAERLRERGSQLELPDDVRAKMEKLGGTNPVLVITKYLHDTDLSTHYEGFSLPLRQLAEGVRDDSRFLIESEWARMESNKDEVVKAKLVGPSCSDPTEVSLKFLWSNEASHLVIIGGWSRFLAEYRNEHAGAVKEGDAVQVWATRCGGGTDDVVLALVVVEPAARSHN